jgi:hypothetical protein
LPTSKSSKTLSRNSALSERFKYVFTISSDLKTCQSQIPGQSRAYSVAQKVH